MGDHGARVPGDAVTAGTELVLTEPAVPVAPPAVPAATAPPRPGPPGAGPSGRGPSGRRLALPRPTPRQLLVAGLLALLAVVVFGNSIGEFATDAKPELYFAPWRSAAAYLSSWQTSPQLGVPNYNVGLVPVAVVVGLIQAVGVSPALSVRVLRLLLLALGAWGAARLYRTLRSERDDRADIGPLVAGVTFVANPFVVVSGGTQAVLLPWAWLPWQLLCLVAALRDPPGGRWWRRWRWPAAFALTFFAMTGLNAGVIPLFQLLAVPVLVLVLRPAVPWRRAAGVLARCAVLLLAVSVYWLVPSLLALRTGTTVVDNSETVEGIFGPSSYAEVLRGLGVWPLYGGDVHGPWLPQYVAYLHNPLVVGLSFGLPVLAAVAAAVSRGTVRRLGLALVAVAAPIMVGVFPPASPSPFGTALRWLFANVPGAAAFRTTNKIGSLLVLGVSLLVAALVVAVLRHTRGRPPWQPAALAVGLVVVLVGGTAPAWTGGLYTSAVNVPGYWTAAAADLNKGPASTRAWFVPGEVLSAYRWSQGRPDDLSTALLARPSLIRMGIPVTSAVAANLLTATDTQLNEGSLPPGALSATARYLGVGELLLRNDMIWEDSGGGRPQVMQDQVNADPGLRPVAAYGAPGQNTISPRYPPSSPFEAALPPLQRYAVLGARPIARVERAAGTVLVDGDGFAVAPLVAGGLLAGEPPFRYLSDLTPAELGRLLTQGVADTGRIVLTDTNRRRTTVNGRLGGSQGPLLPASADPGPTRTLAGPDEQTVLRVEGGQATATAVGSAFGTLAYAAAENAVDGDPATAWQFGDFGHAVGQAITIRTDGPQPVPSVTVRMVARTGVQVSRLRITVGAVTQEVPVDLSGVATLRFDPPANTDTIKVAVAATRGVGFNPVGISEIEVPGVRLQRVARLPRTLSRLAAGLDGAGLSALGRTPVDVVLSRVRGTGLPGDDEEIALSRDFELPVDRDYRGYGLIRPGKLDEAQLDALAGAAGRVAATSTSRAFGLPTLRASQAVDGNPGTAWVPGEPVVGQSLTISAPPRLVDHVNVTQLGPDQRGPADWATRVLVSVDGRAGVVRELGPGTTRLDFTPLRGGTLRLTVLATHSGSAQGLVRLSEVDFGGARMTFDRRRAASACVPVGTVDGVPLSMRPVLPVTAAGAAVWAGCGRISLAAGAHTVRPDPRWTVDELVLRDSRGDTQSAAAAPPLFQVTQSHGPGFTVGVSGATGPYYLLTGQAYDTGWHASLDGRDLGPPVPVDGYAAGWYIDRGGSHTITVRYGPQRVADAALIVSMAAVVGCLALLVFRAPPPAEPEIRRRPRTTRGRWRRRLVAAAGWLGLIALGWLFGGLLLATAAVALAGWHLRRWPSPRLLVLAGAAVLAAVPVVWLALRPDPSLPVSPLIIQDNPWPHRLAAVGLLLVVVGVVRSERARSRRAAAAPPDQPAFAPAGEEAG